MLEDYLSDKQKKRKKRKRQFLFFATIFGIIVVLGFLVWLVVWSPVFRVKQVVVQGENIVSSDSITALLDTGVSGEHGVMRFILGPNNMLVWPDTVASSGLSSLPPVLNISISKNYFDHTITATVTEREPFAIWCAMPQIGSDGNPTGDEDCYWFDTTGTLFEPAFDTEGSALFAVHDYSGQNITLGGQILPDIFIPNLVSILNVLKQSGLTIKEVAIQDLSLEEVDVSTYNGPEVYFSLRFPADEDLAVLQSLMTQPGFDQLQYVDFRVENRAYYK